MNSNIHKTPSDCTHQDEKSPTSWAANRRKSWIVLWITTATMVVEIYFGYLTGSMGLLADGWHMATHAAALGITYLTYVLAASPKISRNFNFGGGKILFLGGFASSLLLFFVSASVIFESTHRLMNPQVIAYNEALWVAVIGLVINLICAWILRDDHSHGHLGHEHEGHSHDDGHTHDDGDSDHSHNHSHNHTHHHNQDMNIRGAFLHVMADALTSLGAIGALLAAKYWGLIKMDPLIGIISALVIVRWAWTLFKDAAWELLDGHARGVAFEKLRQSLQKEGSKVIDLHVWRVAPSALNCELIIESAVPKGLAFYRQIIEKEFGIHHSVIEERVRKP